jgi:DNA replication and repair protein RecF
MQLLAIQLVNFKCKEALSLSFGRKLSLLTGANGTGKTTVLDAIYAVCIGKSALQSQDKLIPGQLGPYYFIKGVFELTNGTQSTVTLSWQEGEKKKIQVNGKALERISEHLGKFPVVMIAPQDHDLIQLGAELRRKFFDSVICQQNQLYLEKLSLYLKLIEDRNTLIKRYQENRMIDEHLLDVYDEQLGALNLYLHETRIYFLQQFQNDLSDLYISLSERTENVKILYKSASALKPELTIFQNSRNADFQAGRSTVGIHRDDFEFLLNDELIRRMGSQGQQKTFLIAMKLAVYKVLYSRLQVAPLLLLDDIFDKLDEERVSGLLKLVSKPPFSQVFISDARPERSVQLLSLHQLAFESFHIPDC